MSGDQLRREGTAPAEFSRPEPSGKAEEKTAPLGFEIRDRIRELRRVKARELLPNPKNWRRHSKLQTDALRGLLREIGYADALLAREKPDGRLMLIDGHLRAQTTPDAEVPVLVLDVTEEEADKILATLDPLAALAESDSARIEALLRTVRTDDVAVKDLLRGIAGDGLWKMLHPEELREVEVSADRADELRAKWRTESGQLWQIGPHRLLCGDCRDESQVTSLWEKAPALARLWTDAPYGVRYSDKNRFLNRGDRGNRIQKPIANDHLSELEIGTLFRDALALASRYCEPGAAVYASVPGGPLLVRFIGALEAAGFTFKSTLVWVKNHFVLGLSDYHFCHELILYGWLVNGPHLWNGGRSQDSVFEVDRPQISDLHPTSKPVELIARMIANSSRVGELVLRSFLRLRFNPCGRASARPGRLRLRDRLRLRGGSARTAFATGAQAGIGRAGKTMKRQPNGTWRAAREPLVASESVLRARWIESETIHLKRMGLSFDAIAEQITQVGRGQAAPLVAIPEGVTFPVGYRISKQACHKAFRKALAREPALEIEEMRQLDNARSEELYMNLQPGIRKGNPRAVEVGIKVLDHSARINGYAAPLRHELTGKDGKPLTLVQLLEAVGPIEDEDEKQS